MQSIPYREAYGRLPDLVDEVSRQREAIVIEKSGGSVVLVSEEEFSAMQETIHLLSTPANVERLRQGLADYKNGKAQAGDLCD